jgi:hypothetical protein
MKYDKCNFCPVQLGTGVLAPNSANISNNIRISNILTSNPVKSYRPTQSLSGSYLEIVAQGDMTFLNVTCDTALLMMPGVCPSVSANTLTADAVSAGTVESTTVNSIGLHTDTLYITKYASVVESVLQGVRNASGTFNYNTDVLYWVGKISNFGVYVVSATVALQLNDPVTGYVELTLNVTGETTTTVARNMYPVVGGVVKVPMTQTIFMYDKRVLFEIYVNVVSGSGNFVLTEQDECTFTPIIKRLDV